MEGNIEELTFLEFLSYMPLFLGIHDHIVEKPLDMQKDRRSTNFDSVDL